MENIWMYIIAHAIAAFVVTVIVGKIGLPMLKKMKAGQHVREEGPKSHEAKTGTPTMGGWFFIIGILVVLVVSNTLMTGTLVSSWYYVATLLLYASIGFIDDFLKVVLKRNLGLTSKQKLALQIVMVLALFVFFKDHFADSAINIIFMEVQVPTFVFILFAIFWFVGFSNATNVTDGLDGLLPITGVIAFGALGVIALLSESFASSIFCFVVVGALLGFLVFNHHPAKVFMGDTGSLALGALFAAISLELNVEFYLLLIGIVFVIETLSVMLQVAYFKYTKKKYGEGKRIFLMSPYHHHLELKGNDEQSIVRKLAYIGLVGAILAIAIFYVTM